MHELLRIHPPRRMNSVHMLRRSRVRPVSVSAALPVAAAAAGPVSATTAAGSILVVRPLLCRHWGVLEAATISARTPVLLPGSAFRRAVSVSACIRAPVRRWLLLPVSPTGTLFPIPATTGGFLGANQVQCR